MSPVESYHNLLTASSIFLEFQHFHVSIINSTSTFLKEGVSHVQSLIVISFEFISTFDPGDIKSLVVTDEIIPPGDYILSINATDVLEQFVLLDVPFTLTRTYIARYLHASFFCIVLLSP